MADITPSAARAAGFHSSRQWVPLATPGVTPLTVNKEINQARLAQRTFYFADADNNDLFIPPKGTVACAWQPNVLTAGTLVTATIGATGIIFTGGTNAAGWLHTLDGGTQSTGSTTTEAPVSKGTAGYVEPGRGIFLNHRHATPNTLTNAKRANKLGMKLRFFPFDGIGTSDRWTSQSAGLCPGIVAVAWQPGIAAEDVIVTLDAAGDVIFTSTSSQTETGWLWAWSR